MTVSARNWAWDVRRRTRLPTDPPPKNSWDDGMVSIRAGEKLVLLCLAEHESYAEGYAYPSYERISACTGLSVRAVQDHVKTLQAANALAVERARGVQGQWRRNVYYLNVPEEYREKDPTWSESAHQRFE